MPTWEDHLDLAFTEIRLYGAGSPFVVREMRRTLGDLRRLAPAERLPSVDGHLDLLELAVRDNAGSS